MQASFAMRGDLQAVGAQAAVKRYIVSGGTAIEAGEPLHTVGSTVTSGAQSVNTSVLAAADTPVIGTHWFRGIALAKSLNVAAGTVKEQFLPAACPVPGVGRVRGLAETASAVDTIGEAGLLYGDMVLIDYNSTGASDGGELYTIKVAASANTSGLELVEIDPATQIVGATPHMNAYRNTVS